MTIIPAVDSKVGDPCLYDNYCEATDTALCENGICACPNSTEYHAASNECISS